MTRKRDDRPTPRQMEVYRYIWEYTLSHGYQPGYQGIMAAFGCTSRTAALTHLIALEKKGYVRRPGGLSKSLEFLRTPDGQPFRGFLHIDEEDLT